MSLGVALKRAFVDGSELPTRSIRVLLLADVLADLLQFKPDRGDGVATSPEMLARKISLFAAQPGNGDRALPFEEPNYGCDRVLRGNCDAHVYMVRHEVPFNNLTLLLPSQGVENQSQMTARLAEDRFPPPLGNKHNMVLAVPFRMG
jgi:hypothetical protein